ncbi:MAG TPA: hypothetical protein ENI24_10925 [Methylophaga sp.]|nr:hypothetical protein [Methylophaga sp.]
MNKSFLQSVLSIVILMMTFSAQAQALWGETTLGMTPSEVIKMVEGSYLNEEGDTLETGAKELVQLDDLRVIKELYNVKFYFIDDALTQVTLNLIKQRSFPLTLLVFQSLTDALSSKYGKPLSRKIDSIKRIKTADAYWLSDGTIIDLQVKAVDDDPTSLNITYQLHLDPQQKSSTDLENL